MANARRTNAKMRAYNASPARFACAETGEAIAPPGTARCGSAIAFLEPNSEPGTAETAPIAPAGVRASVTISAMEGASGERGLRRLGSTMGVCSGEVDRAGPGKG